MERMEGSIPGMRDARRGRRTGAEALQSPSRPGCPPLAPSGGARQVPKAPTGEEVNRYERNFRPVDWNRRLDGTGVRSDPLSRTARERRPRWLWGEERA